MSACRAEQCIKAHVLGNACREVEQRGMSACRSEVRRLNTEGAVGATCACQRLQAWQSASRATTVTVESSAAA